MIQAALGVRQAAKPLATAKIPPPPVKHALDFIATTEPTAQYEDRPTVPQRVIKNGKMLTVQVPVNILDPEGKEIHFRKAEGHDLNGDGRSDLGRLIPGTYKFHFGGFSKGVNSDVLRGDSQQAVQRDVNHDGEFNAADVWQTEKGQAFVEKGDFAILIHPGSQDNTFSGGCQTIPRAEFQRFYKTLKKQNAFYYVLVSIK